MRTNCTLTIMILMLVGTPSRVNSTANTLFQYSILVVEDQTFKPIAGALIHDQYGVFSPIGKTDSFGFYLVTLSNEDVKFYKDFKNHLRFSASHYLYPVQICSPHVQLEKDYQCELVVIRLRKL